MTEQGLLAEVRRLRALIKQAEWLGGGYEDDQGDVEVSEGFCPWCGAQGYDDDWSAGDHKPTCPAFPPSGETT